jgi:hypothetical protein
MARGIQTQAPQAGAGGSKSSGVVEQWSDGVLEYWSDAVWNGRVLGGLKRREPMLR